MQSKQRDLLLRWIGWSAVNPPNGNCLVGTRCRGWGWHGAWRRRRSSSGVMKPRPLWSLNHVTIAIAILSPPAVVRGRALATVRAKLTQDLGESVSLGPNSDGMRSLSTRRYQEYDVPSPIQLRQQERREEKLRNIRELVAEGKLVIRQMTPDERKRFPPLESASRRAASKRS